MKTENLLSKYIFLNDMKNQFTQNIDFSKTTVSEVSEKTYQVAYASSNKNVELHDYIFKFYAYNEILASFREKKNGIISKEDLTVFTNYQEFVNDFSKRVFSFILHACIAEARHSGVIGSDYNQDDDYEYGQQVTSAFIKFSIDSFHAGKKTKLFSSALAKLKEEYNEKEYEAILKKPARLTKYFDEFLENNYNLPYDIPESFKKAYKKSSTANNKINPNTLRIFKNEYVKGKAKLDNAKLQRFSNFWEFLDEVSNSGSSGEGGSLQRDLIKNQTIQKSKIKDLPIAEMLEYLSVIFRHGFDYNSGYGGEPWSDIAQHGLSFAQGKINSEIFIDQALSLEHNNGQMFNKNFIFQDNFSSAYFRFLLNDNNSSLDSQSVGMNIKDFILHLQNSSSVLSIANIKNKSWSNLTKNLDSKKMKEIHSDLSNKHISYFEENFTGLEDFSKKLKFLPEMTALAKKVDYSIPSFDFANMMLVSLEKQDNYYKSRFEKSISTNHLFSNIIDGHFMGVTHSKKQATTPTFKCHNLNATTAKKLTKELIGGKAKGLTDLINKGFNVPKAMVFDTKTCLSYLDNPKHFHNEYKTINQNISDYLVDENNKPLLVSVRSGAPVSMPGMMDSILNAGIDDTTYEELCKTYGKPMVNDCANSFMHQFCASKLGLNIKFPKNLNNALDKFAEILIKNDVPCNRKATFPLDKESQIKLCVEAVFDSWNSPRAIAWRNEKKISHTMGTAATVQQMVFGNKNDKSLTCVIFSRDCISGKPEIMGEYLVKAQGEDLVSGKRTPIPISELEKTNPDIYKQIEYIAKVLEVEKKAIQDLEITVEDNQVFLLQMRNAVVSPEAQLLLAKELDLNLLDIVQPKHLMGDIKVDTTKEPDFKGMAASPGLISGIIVKNEADIEKYKNEKLPLIFFSNQALPEHAPIMIATQAFVTEFGGSTSHAAILARSMGKPCVVGIGKQKINSGDVITLDASEGRIWKGNLPIIINQENAILLSKKILAENDIIIPKTLPKSDFSLQSWTTQLSKSTVLSQPKTNSNKMFLNIAQQTALLLQMEHKKSMKA